MKKFIFLILAAAVTSVAAVALPARRGFVQVTGADGQPMSIQLVGDENGHYLVDTEGRIVIRQNDVYVHATEDVAARKKAAIRRIPGAIGTMPSVTFPAKGKQKAVVVLVEYQDQKFMLGDHAYEYFNDMLNKDGFNEYGGTGSVHEYFMDSSNGQFDCQFDVFGPVTLSKNMAYYGGNNSDDMDSHPEEMVIEACQQLDATVDFSQYDRDNNGIIDNVYLIYAGRGEASDIYGDYPDTVWPHAWDVSFMNLYFDGKKLASYGCSNEWEDIWVANRFTGRYEKNGENPDGIGTFVHEFSHVIGLPDLYDTEDSSTVTPGEWSVLDYGPYNNNGRTPPAYSSFERNALGWIELIELTDDMGDITIAELNASNSAYCITNPSNPDEFYLLEARAKTGWDKYLPGNGMLIWHIDYDGTDWDNNIVNNNNNHLGVDLVEADGKTSKDTRNAADAFPGTKNVTSYTPKWWNKSSTGVALSNIALATDNAVSLTVESTTVGGGDKPYFTVADVQASSMTGDDVTVRGYIVGYANSAFSAKGVCFTSQGCKIYTNVVLADDKNEKLWSNCIPVQLPSGAVRNQANLIDNPSHLGKLVEFDGGLYEYFSHPGIKYTSAFRIIDETNGLTQVEEVTPTENIIYDLSGRRVVTPSRPGLYIINGKKVML